MLVILCGKSAVGKDSILNELVNKYGFIRYRTCTTRPIRKNEEPGREYMFLSDAEFQTQQNHKGFLEVREFSNYRYGSPIFPKEVALKTNWVIILDPAGAKACTEYYGKDACLVVGLVCPEEIRKDRAQKRGSFDEAAWIERKKADDKDFESFGVISDVIFDTGLLNSSVIVEKIRDMTRKNEEIER